MSRLVLYFIRHGETYLNKYKKMQGWSDAPLTEKGIVDAIATGQRLKDIKFDAIYASDLGRTQKTAELIQSESEKNKELLIIPKAELRESFFGSLDGSFASDVYGMIAEKLAIEVKDIFKDLSLEEIAAALNDVDPTHDSESQEALLSRLQKGLKDIISRPNDKEDSKIMVVTHGNVIRAIVNMIDPNISVKQELKNSGLTTIAFEDGVGQVIGFNE
ncbi:MAG: histidine phosphatase family protein [Lactovum sp.]